MTTAGPRPTRRTPRCARGGPAARPRGTRPTCPCLAPGPLGHEAPGPAGAQVDLAHDEVPALGAVPTDQQLGPREGVEHQPPGGVEGPGEDDFRVGGASSTRHGAVIAGGGAIAPARARTVAGARRPAARRAPRRGSGSSRPSSGGTLEPVGGGPRGRASSRHGRRWASRRRETSPARSSTLRCLEMAGWLMANGRASSVTVASPAVRRRRMARRVGSASAMNVASSWASLGGSRRDRVPGPSPHVHNRPVA